MKLYSKLAILAVAGAAASANGTVIWGTGFEAPDYNGAGINGTPLNGQNGWTTGILPGTGATAGNIANVINDPAGAFAGSQYVSVKTSSFTNDSTTSTYRLSYGYAGHSGLTAVQLAANPVVHVSCAIYMATPTGTRGGFATVNSYDATFASLGAIGLAWTGAGIATAGPFATANTSYLYIGGANANAFVFSGSAANSFLNGWIVFDESLDYSTGLISYSVNGSSLDATLDGAGFDRSFSTSILYDQTDFQAERDRPSAGASSGGAAMRFDNYLVENLPAPSSAALIGLGGLLAARRRRN